MKIPVGKSLWIAGKIWLFAVLINTAFGCIFLLPFGLLIIYVAFLGFFWSGLYSLPVLLLMFLALVFVQKQKYSYRATMGLICVAAIAGAAGSYWLFLYMESFGELNFVYITAAVAGLLAVFTQRKKIKALVEPENPLDELFKTENHETTMV